MTKDEIQWEYNKLRWENERLAKFKERWEPFVNILEELIDEKIQNSRSI